ncbi:MAG: hypothetical protein Q3M24_13375 [Candidatus Electrothrix aestuarii]|uniref:CRISPR-associated protein Csx11 n=1 Tax=Candidatus Electrothrix aestuarii TaxID=3062594 RepID=A0AAU8LQK5_9BACT|nr:hypothetical protein [Candidatus Electrothrix aestuarii]
MSRNRAEDIEQALEKHSRFLAYVRVNALLHDCDKSFSQYLLWSLLPKEKRAEVPDYTDHHASNVPGKASVKRKEYRQHWCDTILGTEEDFKAAPAILFPAPSCYAAYLDKRKKERLHIALEQTTPCHSIYDFFTFHHDAPHCIQEAGEATALFLFISGVAGIDGNDTRYETEMEAAGDNYSGHHAPNTAADKTVLISTPFGFEKALPLQSAETGCRFAEDIKKLIAALEKNNNPMQATALLERKIEQPFRATIIRTARPLNDVTLADHSLSTAALSVAQAARVVLENISRPSHASYCLPVRRPREDVPSQQTSFAAFSCAVNADKLDHMALELKDITAIREEVDKLLTHFLELFSIKYPVGGMVYKDQHGAHLIIPALGDPKKRWSTINDINNEQVISVQKVSSEDACTQHDFVEWLFATAQKELQELAFKERPEERVHFGIELLIGLRYNRIFNTLNNISNAINWSREISWLNLAKGGNLEEEAGGGSVEFFTFPDHSTKEITYDLCGVCGLRQGIPSNKHRKCNTCQERIKPHRVGSNETGDIEKMISGSSEYRLVLLSVSFHLADWLAETSNSGIFCHTSPAQGAKQSTINKKIKKEKSESFQRFNSFGRFRRIWRSTEIFLQELRNQIRKICGHSNEEQSPYLMRTILLAPQDLQIILPAAQAGKALDAVYEKFTKEFGRVSDRMPFHVSLCIFPYRVPIYLVLEAARRLRDSCLKSTPKKVFLSRTGQGERESTSILRTDTLTKDGKGKREFTYPLPMICTQEHQPENIKNIMNNNDQFHANICIERDTQGKARKWIFLGEIQDTQPAWMTDNRLAVVEISSGFSLDELTLPSEKLQPSRCHDIPLGYWPSLKKLIRLEQENISETQQRKMRSVLAMREKLWHKDDLPGNENNPLEQENFLQESIRTLWREPSRFGPTGWQNLPEDKKKLLEESCLNGAFFLASTAKKYLWNEEPDRD